MKNFKPLDQYEKDLRGSIKKIQKLNDLHWTSLYIDRSDPEYYKSKFGENYTGGYPHQDL